MSNTDQIRAAIAAIDAGADSRTVNIKSALAFGKHILWVGGKDLYDPASSLQLCDDVYGNISDYRKVPNYCQSLDAIMAEKPKGWVFDIKTSFHGVTNLVKWQVAVFLVTLDGVEALAISDRLTVLNRALLLALLRAMEAQADAS